MLFFFFYVKFDEVQLIQDKKENWRNKKKKQGKERKKEIGEEKKVFWLSFFFVFLALIPGQILSWD